MKPRIATQLNQQLVLTPQLRQAIRLLQLSAVELEAELSEAVASNPLLDWTDAQQSVAVPERPGEPVDAAPPQDAAEPEYWDHDAEPWQERIGPVLDQDDAEPAHLQASEPHTLREHLLWQLRLSHLSPADLQLGAAIIDAIDEDGYLREPLETLLAGLGFAADAVPAAHVVLQRIQHFDPVGVGARDLGECLRLQLQALSPDTPALDLALRVAGDALPALPRIGIDGLARQLGCSSAQAEAAVQLLRSLDPRPGAQYASLPESHYVTPDCVVWRHQGLWRVALAQGAQPRVAIHRSYAAMVGRGGQDDAWLRGRLQEARWLIKGLESRAVTLLRVMRHLVREQSAFLDFGPQALRPLTLRSVADALGMHESTISRAIAHKHVRTPRGTVPMRAFFASGVETQSGGSASSTAIQDMIRRLVDAEDPRHPLSDARLAQMLKEAGVPVARRTVAKYREAMNIPSSHERVRLG